MPCVKTQVCMVKQDALPGNRVPHAGHVIWMGVLLLAAEVSARSCNLVPRTGS